MENEVLTDLHSSGSISNECARGRFPHSVGIFQGWIKEMVVGPWEREVIIIFTFNFSLMWQSQFLISYHRAWLHFSLQSPITPHFLGGGDKDNALLSPSVEPHVWWVPLERLDKKREDWARKDKGHLSFRINPLHPTPGNRGEEDLVGAWGIQGLKCSQWATPNSGIHFFLKCTCWFPDII